MHPVSSSRVTATSSAHGMKARAMSPPARPTLASAIMRSKTKRRRSRGGVGRAEDRARADASHQQSEAAVR